VKGDYDEPERLRSGQRRNAAYSVRKPAVGDS